MFHLDVKTTFLNGDLKEETYMTQSSRFMEEGKEHKFCKLLKSLYKLKQAPRAWYEKIDSYLKDHGLSCSDVDHNLYYLKSDDKIVILILYLDDLSFIGDHEKKINQLKEQLKARFEMIDLGLLSFYLGIEFLHLPKGIFLGQRSYVKQMLEVWYAPLQPCYNANVKYC